MSTVRALQSSFVQAHATATATVVVVASVASVVAVVAMASVVAVAVVAVASVVASVAPVCGVERLQGLTQAQPQVSRGNRSVCKTVFLRSWVCCTPGRSVPRWLWREQPSEQQLAPQWSGKAHRTCDKTCSDRHWLCHKQHIPKPRRYSARWTQVSPP